MRSPNRLADTRARDTIRGWLEQPRYEVLPVAGIVDEVGSQLVAPTTITVTASPARGIDATAEVAVQLAGLGHHVVPHLAARQLRDVAQLEEVITRLTDGGIREVFVIGGDADPPAGTFRAASEVVEAVALIDPGLSIGIAGYPETHPKIPDDVAIQAMWDKRRHASYVVSQVCFEPRTVLRWIARLRARGIDLPVLLGTPGPIPTAKLLLAGRRIGVGESLRFLTGHANLARLARPGRFDPVPLLTGVAGADPGVAGLHFYTFNAIAEAEAWRHRLLSELVAADDRRQTG